MEQAGWLGSLKVTTRAFKIREDITITEKAPTRAFSWLKARHYASWLLQVLTVYMSGVAAGSLGTSLTDSSTYLAGASGGVYALIAAHLATMTLNWREDNNLRIKKVVRKPLTKIIRLVFILLLTAHDVCFAVYVRFYDPDNRTGFMGHLCGALAGLTVGLFVLDNRFGFFS